MSISGSLTIQLQYQQLATKQLDVKLSRPALARKLLLAKHVDSAPDKLAQLFSICRYGQWLAAKLATNATNDAEHIIEQHGDKLVMENISQGFWRLCLEVPSILKLPLSLEPYKKLQQYLIESSQNLSQDNDSLFVGSASELFLQLTDLLPEQFLSLSSDEFKQWLEQPSIISQLFSQLPDCDDENLVQKLKDELLPAQLTDLHCQQLLASIAQNKHFSQQPVFLTENSSSPKITGPISYAFEQPLIQACIAQQMSLIKLNVIAKLLFIAQSIKLLSKPNKNALKSIAGVFAENEHKQLAWVQTARGILIHYCQHEQQTIQHYDICAPTEWNFHPNSLFVEFLSKTKFRSKPDIESQTRLAVIGIDPCIDFSLGVNHA